MITLNDRSNEVKTYQQLLLVVLSHSGTLMMIFLIVSCLAARLYLGHLTYIDIIIPVFFVSFRGFIEWFLHYYIWHEKPLPLIKKSIKNPIARMHRVHHQQPNIIKTLLFGGGAVFLSSVLVFMSCFLMFSKISVAITFLFSYLVILFIYDFFHLMSHSSIHPKSKFIKEIISNHRQHHFKNENKSWAVSSTLPDKLFGTY